eukprot:7085943-Prymnesium_polylepis.1
MRYATVFASLQSLHAVTLGGPSVAPVVTPPSLRIGTPLRMMAADDDVTSWRRAYNGKATMGSPS